MARGMSFGLGASTRIFGMITAKNKNAKIQAIRHEIRPTFGFSYRPDFNKRNYDSVQVDVSGTKELFPIFPSGANIFSPYSPGEFGGITFGIDNNIQMKYCRYTDKAFYTSDSYSLSSCHKSKR